MRPGSFSSPANNVAVLAAIISVIAAFYVMGHSKAHYSAVAFVDFQAIMQQSDAGKSIQDQIAPRQKALQDAAQVKLKEFTEDQDQLKKQRHSLSDQAYSESGVALEKNINDWNVEAKKRDTELGNAASPAFQKVDAALREVLAKIASENKFTAILPLQEAFYAENGLDVTSEAIRRLNEQLPKVIIQFEDGKKAK